MTNKKLIDDLKKLVDYPDQYILESYVSNIASRAIDEIKRLENQVRDKQSELDWYDFKPGDMK